MAPIAFVALLFIGSYVACSSNALAQGGVSCEKLAESARPGQDLKLGANALAFRIANKGTLVVKASVMKGEGESMSQIWGAESGPAETYFYSLGIALNGVDIHVPYSSYGDLGNPYQVSVHIRPRNTYTLLFMGGGDGANGWFMCLDVRSGKVVRRVVLSQFEWREETNYR